MRVPFQMPSECGRCRLGRRPNISDGLKPVGFSSRLAPDVFAMYLKKIFVLNFPYFRHASSLKSIQTIEAFACCDIFHLSFSSLHLQPNGKDGSRYIEVQALGFPTTPAACRPTAGRRDMLQGRESNLNGNFYAFQTLRQLAAIEGRMFIAGRVSDCLKFVGF